MTTNPANTIKDAMWTFFMDKGQEANVQALKEYVYDLIKMTTQKTAGQPKYKAIDHISWELLDMTLMSIAIEATALVLSGKLEEVEMFDWISAKDRLPEKEGEYLVVHNCGCGGVMVRHFYEACPDAFVMDRSVTHWMPLPEPPQKT